MTTVEDTKDNKTLVTRETQAFGIETVERSSELAAVAVSSAARAEVEAAYVMAIKSPRHEETARTKILASCRNPGFAVKARYRKPMGSKEINGRWEPQFVVGPSIRFAEEMLRCWKNVLVQQVSLYDDQIKRIVRITTRDLEANLAFSKEITLDKSVERRSSKDRDVLGQRTNSSGYVVYIVRSTEDELLIKESALSSKVIRNNGLRLIPQHIIDEAMAEVEKIIKDKAAKDPEGERRAVLDGFARRGVTPLEIERYMNGPSAQFSADDLVKLREMLTSIEDGHTTWQEYLEGTSSQTTNDIAEKSQVETKGVEVLGKLKDVAHERGVDVPAKTPQLAQEQSKSEEHVNLAAPVTQTPTKAATAPDPPVQVDPPKAPVQENIEAIKDKIATAEFSLKSTDVGKKKYQAVLSVMKVRLQKGQEPMDVLPPENLYFYLAQLQRAVDAMKATK